MDITELLAFVVKNKASDLHLSSGLPPMIRVHGDIRRINLPALEQESGYDAIRLFIDHASTAWPGFELAPTNAAAST